MGLSMTRTIDLNYIFLITFFECEARTIQSRKLITTHRPQR